MSLRRAPRAPRFPKPGKRAGSLLALISRHAKARRGRLSGFARPRSQNWVHPGLGCGYDTCLPEHQIPQILRAGGGSAKM